MNNSDFPEEIFGPVFSVLFSATHGDETTKPKKQKPVYRASPIKRKRRTKAEIEQLEQQIYAVLAEDHPQSVRHVFYRMTDPRLPVPIEKTERGYIQVQQRCTVMRRAEKLPYGWFSDMSRQGYFTDTYRDASDFIMKMQGLYRADTWRDAECRCEVWVESRSIAGVLLGSCQELAVDLYPCGGFPSLTFVYQAAEANNRLDDDRPLVVFYVGDYDPSGVLIDRKLEQELRQHLRPGIELHFKRLAINPEQIVAYDLPTKPRKKNDRRELHIERTVEAEAMPARTLRFIVKCAVENLLPANALKVAKVAEESERAHLIHMAGMLSRDQ